MDDNLELRPLLQEGKYLTANEVDIRISEGGLPEDANIFYRKAETSHRNIADKNILELASGGLALQGVYQTENNDDLVKNRQKLIKIANYKFLRPQDAGELIKLYEFSSLESQEYHEKVIKQIGFKFSIPKGPSVSAKCDVSSIKQKQTKTEIIRLMMCSYIPLACVEVDYDQIRISDSALEQLKEISALLPTSESDQIPLHLFERATTFFEKFGSAASQGPFHLGGVFWKKACAKLRPDQQAQMNTMKTTVIGKLQEAFNASGEVQKSSEILCNQLNIEVQMSVVMVGGPPGEDDYHKWKTHLCDMNMAVVDRGNLVPVWTIIKLNHRKDFSDYNKLCQFLKKAYETITKQIPKPEKGEQISEVVSEAKQLMESVKTWLPQGDSAETHLIELLQMKRKMKNITLSFHAWIDICLSDENLQKFLLSVTDTQNAAELKQLMRSIIDIESGSLKAFPKRDMILRWVQENVEQRVESDKLDVSCQEEPQCNLHELEEKGNNIPNENDTSVQEASSKTFQKLLTELGLQKKTKSKLLIKDFVMINSLSLSTSSPAEEIKAWSHYLYKLMSLDSSVRYLCFKSQCKASEKRDCTETSEKDEPEDDFYDFGEYLGASCKGEDANIHPMDLHMAVFNCCDPFAQLYICRQLSLFQFALPLLIPSPLMQGLQCPLWVLKQIQRCSKDKTQHVLKASIPVVSFTRLGTSAVSKSQIMNSVISNRSLPIFFNRDMKNSTRDCILLEGVVEIFWFSPSGNKDDAFEMDLAFINLHGDMKDHPKQLKLIKDVSSVIVLLLPENTLDRKAKYTVDELRESQVPIITLFTGIEGMEDRKRIGAKNKNKAELAEAVRSRIRKNLSSPKAQFRKSLENYLEEEVKQNRLIVRSKKEIQKWQDKGQNLFNILTSSCSDILQLKSKCLPLQGDLLAKWCIKDKQFFRPQGGKKLREQEKAEIIQEQRSIRKEQAVIASSSDYKFIPEFLGNVIGMQSGVKYMLDWVEKALVEHFRETIDGLRDQYHKLSLRTKAPEENLKDIRASLEEISKKIDSAFCLKHIMREVAQLYEASVSEEKIECQGLKINRLPEVGADMILSGYPLEIVDGDVNHVPLQWITAVLDQVIHKIGDKKVFVLSVLGPQSSGKSTLLNTMFGLHFEVSSGRCTRGAFIQLIRVEENIKDQLQFDYVLVLDTEGLGSPEKISNSRQHDNEFATFVVGIGDLTLINIMGESPLVMKETLQICFQAFLRMKSVNLKPSCIFVHQNVCEAAAKEKNTEGRIKFFEELDRISQLAGKEENLKVTAFNDIIQIDFNSQVFYFKNYLEGDPPMAPPNPSYSHNVQELKDKLLSIANWRPGFKASKMSEFSIRVNDLWKALLKENFIFQYQNTLAVSVYNRLEKQYMEWSWHMRRHALETHNKLYNFFISDTEQLEKYEENQLNAIVNELQQKVTKFFEEDSHSDILQQWKCSIVTRLDCLKDELVTDINTRKMKFLKQAECIKRSDIKKAELIADFFEDCKKMATVLKAEKSDEIKLRAEFEKCWSLWTAKMPRESPPVERIDVQEIIEKALEEKFTCSGSNIRDRQHEQNFTFQPDIHTLVDNEETTNIQIWGTTLSKKIEAESRDYVSKSDANKIGVSENLIFAILSNINQTISKPEGNIVSPLYIADISAHVLYKEADHLIQMQDEFDRNSALNDFSSQKENYFERFKLACHALSVNTYVEYLMKPLQSAVEVALTKKVTIEMTDKLRSTCPAFHDNRSILEAHIMKHLAIEENFDDFLIFINRPHIYFRTFISNSIETHFFKGDAVSQMYKTNLSLLVDEILEVGCSVTKVIQERKDNASKWLDEFCLRLRHVLPLSRQDLECIEGIDISDSYVLKETFAKSLREMQENQGKRYGEFSNPEMKRLLLESSCDILFQQLSGCWVRCPFCKTVCTNSIPDHVTDHSAQWHRCKGLGYCFSTKWNSSIKQFDIEFCTTSVNSSDSFQPPGLKKSYRFKDYKKAGPLYNKWSIQENHQPKDYWKWFICTFEKELEKEYTFQFKGHGKIPEGWRSIQKSDILKELGV